MCQNFAPEAKKRTDPSSAVAGAGDEGQPAAGAKILIVEDDRDLRELAAAQVEALGYRVITAVDGASALPLLRTDRDIGVLFTDLVMPGPIDGMALAEEARRLHPRIGIVFTSGYVGHAALKRRRPGRDDIFLAKPYRQRDLAAAIARARPA